MPNWGVDTDAALAKLQKISLSLHCWQADDVTGFENPDAQLSGGYGPRATTRARHATSRSCVRTHPHPTRR